MTGPVGKPHRKKWLELSETERLVDSFRDTEYYWIYQLCRYGLRIGEILGRYNMPGIYVRDLREHGIWLNGKGYSHPGEAAELYPLPDEFMIALSKWVSKRPANQKLFTYTVSSAEKAIKTRARELSIPEWEYVSPHRLRAFFATNAKDHGIDAFSIRDMMRHRNIGTTNRYVGRSTATRLQALMNQVSVSPSSVQPASTGPER